MASVLYFLATTFSLLRLTTVSAISNDLLMRMDVYEMDNDLGWLLRDLIERLLYDLNCLTIMTDMFYEELFNESFFGRVSHIPLFKILVRDNEDLLAPNYDTLAVIKQSRQIGCNTYIVLIANGDEVLRFLRFGDRNRVIDTRARYIMLFDIRLFPQKYLYLWKKIVNVLFIRKLQKVNRYELMTVPFPTPMTDHFNPIWLDSWRAGKFQKNNDLFTDKTSNLFGEALAVATIVYMPSTIKKVTYQIETEEGENEYGSRLKKSVEYGGLEIQILDSLSTAMNFDSVIYEPEDWETEAWGRRQLNGSYTGLLGEMVTGSADLALGNFLYTPHNLALFDLSIPYTTQCFTFLTPESTTDNSWKTLILPFKGFMWLGVLLALLICTLVFYCLAKFQMDINKENLTTTGRSRFSFWKDLRILWQENRNIAKKLSVQSLDKDSPPSGLHIFRELDSSLLNTYSMLLLVSLPKMPRGWSLRVFTGSWWLYCILVTVAYRSSMTAILSKPAQKTTIDTLDELATSSIGCGGWGEANKQFFTTSLDSAGQRVGRKFEVIYDTQEAIRRVARGTYAYYENIYFLQDAKARQNKNTTQLGDTGNSTNQGQEEKDLHIMRDCVINMPISLGLRKNSPLKPRIDRFLQRVIEAGLVKKWLADVTYNSTRAEKSIQKTGLKALMDLKKFFGALVALVAGYLLGVLSLGFEIVYWQYVVKRNPQFDKYNRKCYVDKH